MLYIGIVIGLVFVGWFGFKKLQDSADTSDILAFKVVVFLLGIMLLSAVGGSKVAFFNTIGDFTFIVLIIFLAIVLFKKLFIR